ncbi:coiled-coil domain-containing protein 130 homolog [Mya arenaria]|uniref:coiled-coil domain-containing protein 130 homolog n=1 Tax=Mya arenaria TaxID=6604 RepID=UPI0022E39AE2|nr:coiled-coil domain-containing protein 130 homolog [Mya arenaria]
MAERKSVNKYYPPDWDPSKGSVNQYVGQHPLRDRAKKLGQGILVIRFEMPYNIWCGGCGSHIGMGVRYNAEKTKTGMYYTTPLYKFRMKCHLCDNYFEIQTDPKNHDYVILEGARRKEQRWDPKENGQIETEDKAVIKKMATDAMFKLEHGSDDVKKGKQAITCLSSLESRRDEWKDDYMLNKIARQKFREEKRVQKEKADSDADLLARSSLNIPLQKERDEDVKLASLIKYRALDTYDEKQAKKRKEIEKRPIFHSASKVPKIATPEHKSVNILKDNIKSPFGKNASVLSRTKSSLTKASLGICKKEFKTPGLGLLSMKAESQSKGKKIENPTNFETSKYTNGQEINIVEERLKETDEDIEGEVSGNITDDVSTAAIGDDCGQSSKDNVTVPILLDPLKSKPVQAVSGLSLVGSYSDSDSDS